MFRGIGEKCNARVKREKKNVMREIKWVNVDSNMLNEGRSHPARPMHHPSISVQSIRTRVKEKGEIREEIE